MALVALYNSTNGNGWKEQWDLSTTINANGTELVSNKGRIRNLNLSYNSLSGAIPSEIGDLTELTTLYLNNNSLTGQHTS